VPALSRRAAAGANGTVAYAPAPEGYGTDPNLLNPVTPWHRTMTPHQLQLTAALSDLILPGTADAPAPSAIGIPDFVDEWVSAPYRDQRSDRKVILAGLAWLDDESNTRWQCGFLETDNQNRRQLLDVMAPKNGDAALTIENIFFRRLRFVVVGAYYTTPEGFKDIGYIGNVAMVSYPPPTKEEISSLDEALRKLGLATSSTV
jgi:hypothetical protein